MSFTHSLRIAWFTDRSLSGADSLSTYCSRLLLPRLAKVHSIEVFSEATDSEAFGLPHYNYLKAYQRHRERPFDIFFYQLEDSKACRFIRGHIGLIPGVVWVHDLFCNDLGPEACHTSPWETTIKQVYDRDLPFADRSVAPHQLWPRLFRETSLCPVVLFSSDWARNEFARMICNRIEASLGGHIAEVLPVPVELERIAAADSKRGCLSIACASVTGIEGRANKFLQAIKELNFDWRLTWMVNPSELDSARALIREFGVAEERVEFKTPRSVSVWSDVLAKSDIALHLHTSTFGHLAPFTQLSLQAGVPVVVAQSGQGEDLPEQVVFRIVPGLHEATQLREVFKLVQARGARQLGAAGRAYIERTGDPDLIAKCLMDGMNAWAPRLREVWEVWEAIGQRAKSKLIDEVKHLVNDGSDLNGEIDPFKLVIEPALQELEGGR